MANDRAGRINAHLRRGLHRLALMQTGQKTGGELVARAGTSGLAEKAARGK